MRCDGSERFFNESVVALTCCLSEVCHLIMTAADNVVVCRMASSPHCMDAMQARCHFNYLSRRRVRGSHNKSVQQKRRNTSKHHQALKLLLQELRQNDQAP
uniref:Uncharacterized protein n=1 Tax=Ditylum brightwellii TaxID=49249 RepID=A0A7S4R200_9STRA